MAMSQPRRHSHNFQDLAGRRFERLTVLDYAGKTPTGIIQWRCRCDCGKETLVRAGCLTSGNTRSCGCLLAEKLKDNQHNRKHGKWTSPEWSSWSSMRRRCYDPKAISYPDYGGRGVFVCARWRESFDNFLADMGPMPTDGKYSIDRKDNSANYTCGKCDECAANGWPANCCWATPREQAQNRRNSHHVTFQGETLTVAEWARRLGLRPDTLLYRLRAGWPVERALTTPLGYKG